MGARVRAGGRTPRPGIELRRAPRRVCLLVLHGVLGFVFAIGCGGNQPAATNAAAPATDRHASAAEADGTATTDESAAQDRIVRLKDSPHTSDDCKQFEPSLDESSLAICYSSAIFLPPSDTLVAGSAAPWVGEWGAHGSAMLINPSGLGYFYWREYTNCVPATSPCDAYVDDGISSGGHVTFHVRSTSGTEASGETLTTSDPRVWPLRPFSLRFESSKGLLYMPDGSYLCGAPTQTPTPGSTDRPLC